MSKNEFTWPIRVYYEDTDAGGVVFYANYLKFMERARTEMLRNFGYEQDEIKNTLGLIFAVHSMTIKYIKPAIFNDELVVSSEIRSMGKASIEFSQKIFRKNGMTLLCEGAVKVACLKAENFMPAAIPESMLSRFKGALHGS